MRKTLYIHIGNHKTGTTSIQRALVENSELLGINDFSYFCQNHETGDSNKLISIPSRGMKDGIGGHIKDVDRLVAGLFNSPMKNIVISAENLSWVFEKHVLDELYEALKMKFDEIKIIVYLRRQDEQVISHHQEGAKRASSSGSLFYGNEPRAIPAETDHHHYYMDYYQRLSLWADVFGDANIVVKVFDRSKFIDNDVVADFFSILNLPKPDQLQVKLNESLGFQKTKVNHLLNAHIGDSHLRRYLTQFLNNEGKILPSRSNARKYFDQFHESNKMLEKRFGVSFSENFEKYPETDQDVWDETSANEAVSSLLMAINNYDKNREKIRVKVIGRKIKKYVYAFFK